MNIHAGQTILLTGASGGLGAFMTRAFADLKTQLALVAHPGAELNAVRQAAQQCGARAAAWALDLRDPAQRREAVAAARREFGPIDILVNNAGVEFTCFYHELSEEQIRDMLGVNLEAAMVLTRLVLPEMLQRRRGHVVSIASLAGKAGPAFQEPYAATKAGLIAFTFSLRATYRRLGVSASVIVPGFVEAGIYTRLKAQSGCSAPPLLGTSPPEAVARAVVRAIQRDLPETIVNALPVRPLFAFTELFPRAGAWLADKTGANNFFRSVVERQCRAP